MASKFNLSSEEIKNMLQLWDQAGEDPFELIKEEGFETKFLSLVGSKLESGTILYRGLSNFDFKKSSFDIPTSWSSSRKVASYFTEGANNTYMLIILSDNLKGIYNKYNSYDEEEYILAPFEYSIVSNKVEDGVNVLRLIPKLVR